MKESHQRQIISIVYFYLNDIFSGVNILKEGNDDKNTENRSSLS